MKFHSDVITRKILNISWSALATTQASQIHLWENNSLWLAKTPQLVLNSSRIDQQVNGKARRRSKLASERRIVQGETPEQSLASWSSGTLLAVGHTFTAAEVVILN